MNSSTNPDITNTLLEQITQAQANHNSVSNHNDVSNTDQLINDLRRLEEIRPEIIEHLSRLKDLYTEQVRLTNHVTQALKNERRSTTQGITNILESNARNISRTSPNRHQQRQNNDNPIISSFLNMFAGIPLQQVNQQPSVLTTEELALIPVINYNTLSEVEKQNNCGVCQDSFTEEKGPYRKLPCNHIFHTDCVDRWLTIEDSKCPCCRHSVLN